jgi:hypothetical protein
MMANDKEVGLRIWKEVVVAYLKGAFRYSPRETQEVRKTTKNLRTAGLRAEIWIRDVPNTKQEC